MDARNQTEPKGSGGRSHAAPLPARVYRHFLDTGSWPGGQILSEANPQLAPEFAGRTAPDQANLTLKTRGFHVPPTKFPEYPRKDIRGI